MRNQEHRVNVPHSTRRSTGSLVLLTASAQCIGDNVHYFRASHDFVTSLTLTKPPRVLKLFIRNRLFICLISVACEFFCFVHAINCRVNDLHMGQRPF